MKGSFRFTKKERLTLAQDFRRVMRSGKKLASSHYLVFLHENEKAYHRLGIVAKKEIGQANQRNRMKRYLREFFRLHKHQISGALDMVILIKKGNLPGRYRQVEEELTPLLKKMAS